MGVVRNSDHGLRFRDNGSEDRRGRQDESSWMVGGSGDKSQGTVSYQRETARIGEALTSWSGGGFSDYAPQARLVHLRQG